MREKSELISFCIMLVAAVSLADKKKRAKLVPLITCIRIMMWNINIMPMKNVKFFSNTMHARCLCERLQTNGCIQTFSLCIGADRVRMEKRINVLMLFVRCEFLFSFFYSLSLVFLYLARVFICYAYSYRTIGDSARDRKCSFTWCPTKSAMNAQQTQKLKQLFSHLNYYQCTMASEKWTNEKKQKHTLDKNGNLTEWWMRALFFAG